MAKGLASGTALGRRWREMAKATDLGVVRCLLGELDLGPDDEIDEAPRRGDLERWVNALVQADHLSLLVGNGLSISMMALAGGEGSTMSMAPARESAERMGRGEPNIEDWMRSAISAEVGLRTAGYVVTPPSVDAQAARL
jgi:hypothetical protein